MGGYCFAVVDYRGNLPNQFKEYLMKFWVTYQACPTLQKVLNEDNLKQSEQRLNAHHD
jgi:hypothetical protein